MNSRPPVRMTTVEGVRPPRDLGGFCRHPRCRSARENIGHPGTVWLRCRVVLQRRRRRRVDRHPYLKGTSLMSTSECPARCHCSIVQNPTTSGCGLTASPAAPSAKSSTSDSTTAPPRDADGSGRAAFAAVNYPRLVVQLESMQPDRPSRERHTLSVVGADLPPRRRIAIPGNPAVDDKPLRRLHRRRRARNAER
jgi:hypothetical protein